MPANDGMTSRNPIPALLENSLAPPPPNSLVLLTGVLGASTNWLVLRPPSTPMSIHAHQHQAVNLLHNDRFIFVDGLTALCMPDARVPEASSAAGDHVLRGTAVEDVRRGLEGAIAEAEARAGAGGKVFLVLDQMDAWLALGEGGAVEVMDMLLGLREKVHATILTVAADDALLHAQTTTLEREHAAFALSLAHEAYRVMALRLLDTGTARDVSGVMRITGGGKGNGGAPDAEYLYYVSGDGTVRVFERGA
ncbi:hypothetical protein E4U53_002874 [Claviceps sorghi]|nr:hypothetical protein E4U53_002874 [Claviceps sorghi]